MMEFIKTKFGKYKVVFEGYAYVKQKDLVNGVVSFECEKRRNTSICKAKIKLFGTILVGRLNSHTHAPDRKYSKSNTITTCFFLYNVELYLLFDFRLFRIIIVDFWFIHFNFVIKDLYFWLKLISFGII